jgi:Ca2+-binding RTX toxin-like protein
MPTPYFADGRWWLSGDFSGGTSLSSGFYPNPDTLAGGSVYVSGLYGDGNFADTLTGGVTEDFLQGRGGADSLTGGLGMDILDAGPDSDADYLEGGDQDDDYWGVTSQDTVIEFSGPDTGHDSVSVASGNYALPANVEEMSFSSGGGTHTGWGNTLANYIGGGEFADVLYGGDGNDSIIGNEGKDTIYGDAGDDRIDGKLDTDKLYGGGGSDSIDGGQNADTLNGGAGNDTLMGGGNGNSLIGGTGDDLFWIGAMDDVVQELVDQGYDEARYTAAGTYQLGANVEAGTVISGGGSITGNGSGNSLGGDALANVLSGAGGNDSLFGNEGRDTLNGGVGDDMLVGGAGGDRLSGGDGNDMVAFAGGGSSGVTANLATGQATDNFGDVDTLIGIESLYGSSLADQLTGDGSGNSLTGDAGNDVLNGGGGNDQLMGGMGADQLIGGAGIDTAGYGGPGGASGVNANLATGLVTDTWGGIDTLSGVENVFGSSNNDLLRGNALANTLSGSDGIDTLAGAGGIDTLDGNMGNDVFRFKEAGAANADLIFGFTHGSDKIELDDAYFSKLLPASGGALKGINFRLGTAASEADDYIIYDADSGKLYYDADGSGLEIGKKLVATIMGGPEDVTASDFRVI